MTFSTDGYEYQGSLHKRGIRKKSSFILGEGVGNTQKKVSVGKKDWPQQKKDKQRKTLWLHKILLLVEEHYLPGTSKHLAYLLSHSIPRIIP